MDDAEFDRLLHGHMFGTLTQPERERLVKAALESSERALEFAQVDEVSRSLADPELRGQLLDELPDVERHAWWREWLRPVVLVPLATGAIAAVALLILADPGTREAVAPPQVAGNAPEPAPPPPADQQSGALERPAATDDQLAAQLDALFTHAPGRGTVSLTLVSGPESRVGDAMTASVTLSTIGRLYAVVRGPSGRARIVYQAGTAGDAPLTAGEHSFTFAAAGPFDPESGGRSILRVFFVEAGQTPPPTPELWPWVGSHALVAEATYDTVAR